MAHGFIGRASPGADVICRASQACGEKIGTVMRTTHHSTLEHTLPFFRIPDHTRTL
ncbi:MAG: hypothetical protein LUQ37_05180 [Methanoregulaceae archaeon]|nr:hypothetical protein [Methanoregulaceae archaeon]